MTSASIRRERGFGAAGPIGSGPESVRENPAAVDRTVGVLTATLPSEVDDVVRAAAAAQHEWAATTIDERVRCLRAGADALARSDAVLGPVLAEELGKPLADSSGEMRFAAAFLRWVCDAAPRVCADTELDDAEGRVLIIRRPFGTVAAIVPWNAPLILSALKVAPAIATGNSIVVKPSPVAPFAVTAALSILAEQLPPGVLSVVHGGAEVGDALVSHQSVRKVAFTGGERVAQSVLAACAEQLTPTMLELGGNDPALLLDDLTFADDVMERLVFGVFLTSGQVCMAAKRIYVPNRRLDEFVDAFIAAAQRVLVCGDPMSPEVTIGPLATAEQRARVMGLVDHARAEGADVIDLGQTGPGFDPDRGYFLRPTLVRGAGADAPVVTEEQFGPTVPLIGYDSLDAGIAASNASEMALASSVWSDDPERAFAVGRKLEAGMTFINCHNRSGMSLRVPFGGMKRSGFGREFGEQGISEFTQTHALHLPASARRESGHRPNAYPT